MTEKKLQDSTEKAESVSNDNNESKSKEESKADSQGILSYSSKGKQSVISFFGIELTAPSGLKNPGIVYLSFIIINLFIFLVLRSFVSG